MSEIPDDWSGGCPFCRHRGELTRGENQCSRCGRCFEIQPWGATAGGR